MSERPTRREIGAFLAAAALWPQAAMAPGLPQLLLYAALDEPGRACALGAACLRSLPPGQSEQQLAHAILQVVGGAATGTRQEFKRRLASLVAEDFAQGATVEADGWLLSRTEARLYALAALHLKSVAKVT
jgi:hypothetical protein